MSLIAIEILEVDLVPLFLHNLGHDRKISFPTSKAINLGICLQISLDPPFKRNGEKTIKKFKSIKSLHTYFSIGSRG